MVSVVSLFTNLLLVSAALADPSSLLRKNRQSKVNRHVKSDIFNEMSSSNWAGAVVSEGTGTFTSVTGTFTLPGLSGSDGSASAWVGIDGATCQNAILQTGVEFTISGGEVSYNAWYEWYPDDMQYFPDGITLSPGDQIAATVTAYSTTSGLAVIENLTNGQTVNMYLTSSSALCQQDAEWIVEDFLVGGSLVTFADFGSVTFTGPTASDAGGDSYNPSGVAIEDIFQNGQQLTTTSADWSYVTVKYL